MEPEQQKSFVKMYKRRYKHLKEGEKVYFIDGSQPTYNSHAGYGWIATGKQFALKSQDGRKRVKLLGAYDPKSAEAIVREYGTLNQESVIDFLRVLKARNTEKKIHIIWDNVSYQHGKKAVEAAEVLGIRIVYLPGCSPNLNLIERYWGYLKKKVIVNKYILLLLKLWGKEGGLHHRRQGWRYKKPHHAFGLLWFDRLQERSLCMEM